MPGIRPAGELSHPPVAPGSVLHASVAPSNLVCDKPVATADAGQPIGIPRMGSMIWTSPNALHLRIHRGDVYAVIGRSCPVACWPGVGCAWDRFLTQRTVWAKPHRIARPTIRKSSPRSTTNSVSTSATRQFPTRPCGHCGGRERRQLASSGVHQPDRSRTPRESKRHALTDQQRERIKDLLPGNPAEPDRIPADNRLFVDAILFEAKTGTPWRDLPERFGKWNSVWRRIERWCVRNVGESTQRAGPDGTAARFHIDQRPSDSSRWSSPGEPGLRASPRRQ